MLTPELIASVAQDVESGDPIDWGHVVHRRGSNVPHDREFSARALQHDRRRGSSFGVASICYETGR